MSKKLPFHSYNGAEPYLFVSYAHRDEAAVYAAIRLLHERRCRVWYDEGIEVGVNWPQTVAEHLRSSALVVVFLSKNTLASQNCLREINFSVSQRKPMLVVRLDDSELPPGVGMQLSVAPAIPWRGAEQTAEDVLAQLDDSLFGDGVSGYGERLQQGKKAVNGWLIASLALMLLLGAATVALFGTLKGWFGRPGGIQREEIQTLSRGEVTVTRFTSRLSLELLLGSAEGEAVYLCGAALVSDALAIEHGAQGWTIGGEAVGRGPVEDLSLFTDRRLSQLALVQENLTSLEGIEALDALRYLDLSDNPIDDLTPLAALSELETLRILCLPAETDLAPLTALPALKEVAVSYDMVDRIVPLLDAGVRVVIEK